ncbi:TPA: hypothetical protein N0F65_011381 [Lagenidium giganteum]|uniref:DNA polymerase delta subunit 2 n=1 Tax=Lagenidium giganteum TaxID=4803 RepID=A0AAV2ZAI0_9STRA|nr:TPA: hypothetical protein N0F65_011381 [Lagenidium giganteum]
MADKSFHQQYSHIYVARLAQLRDTVLRAIEDREKAASAEDATAAAAVPVLPKIIDLRDGDECAIVGTVLKVLHDKPCVFAALSSDERIVSFTAMHKKLASDEDHLVLEDESGRVELDGAIDVGATATGVILGLRGRMSATKKGVFHVEQVFVPRLAPQFPLPERQASEYVALVSGLHIGRQNDTMPLRNHVLVDYLAGRIGNQDEKQFVARIVRTVFAGNLVDAVATTSDHKYGALAKKSTEQLTLEALPMRNTDELLSTLAATMCVDVMPGETDPSNHTLPQQSFHSCLFPRSARFASFRAVTNPYEAQIGGVQFLGHSGQPVESLLQSTLTTKPEGSDDSKDADASDALDCMARCLEWRHIAPTAPDLLACFPLAKDDPFVLETSPHVFFAGNQKAFQTKMFTDSTGRSTRLITVPSFAETGTIVLVDLKDLSCFPITLA